jgi:glycosyltransferase involved in cell wall biosynthesis
MMTILFIGNFLSGWGYTPQVCEQLSSKLSGRGYQILTASDRKNKVSRLLDMISTTWRKKREYDIAIIEVFSGYAFLWAYIVCTILRYLNKPYVLSLHGGKLPDFSRRNVYKVKKILSAAVAVTVPSDYLRESMSIFREDIQLIHNSIDIQYYPAIVRKYVKPRIVWLRAFQKIYDPCMAVKVIQLLKASVPDVMLTMIGPDKDGSVKEVRSLAIKLGIMDRIELIGRIPKKDVPQHFQKADIFLNTTTIDNAPVSVIEALACGLCIVSTDVGGIPFLLEHEVDALLVPEKDADAMAAAVRRIMTEPGLAERLSRNARAKAEKYDWSNTLLQWEYLLNNLPLKREER